MSKSERKKILLIGVLPPPIGGVSIHLKRLYHRLKQEGYHVRYLDYQKERNLMNIFKKVFEADIIHTHLSNKKIRFWSTILLRVFLFKKTCITFHGKYDFRNVYDRWTLLIASSSIILNMHSYENALKFKKTNIHISGAFLIPDAHSDPSTLRDSDRQHIANIKQKYDMIYCTNASGVVYDTNGLEIYCGREMVRVFSTLAHCALVFSDPSGAYRKIFEKEGVSLPSNIHIIDYSHDFIEVIKSTDCFLRITTTDGDSLSVKEALFFGKPVIATTVVDRPPGTLLVNDSKQLVAILNNLKKPLEPVEVVVEDNFVKLSSVYV